jgi:FAD/FMN-containing dehydrogenase
MPVSRREFLQAAGAMAGLQLQPGTVVNDIHSQLNATRVREIVPVATVGEIQRALVRAREAGLSVSVAGGRHAMGAQQFASGSMLLDMTGCSRVRSLSSTGIVEIEGGTMWPALVDHLLKVQEGVPQQWGFAQKQTGADRLTIGGALSANVHGRGLKMKPFIADVESFDLVDADGELRRCSRTQNGELFRLAIGGYGLFGVIAAVRLRLVPRRKVRRVVEVRTVDDLPAAFESRIADGFTYGDFQFAVDERSPDFLRRGVFSCYQPVDGGTPVPDGQRELMDEDWHALLLLAHNDKTTAFDRYAKYYLSTSGQIYWSDTHQLSTYLDDYHVRLDAQLGAKTRATEMITEIYVPRRDLPSFMSDVAEKFRGPRWPRSSPTSGPRPRESPSTSSTAPCGSSSRTTRASWRGRASLMPASSSTCTSSTRLRISSDRRRPSGISSTWG